MGYFIWYLYLLVIILISWVFFSHDYLSEGLIYLKAMFGQVGNGFFNTATCYLISNFYILLILGVLFATPVMNKLKSKLPQWMMYLFYVGTLILSTAYLVDSTFNPFLYFRF